MYTFVDVGEEKSEEIASDGVSEDKERERKRRDR